MPVMEKGIDTHPNNFLKTVRVMKGFLKFPSKTKKNEFGGFSMIDPLNMELQSTDFWHSLPHSTVLLHKAGM